MLAFKGHAEHLEESLYWINEAIQADTTENRLDALNLIALWLAMVDAFIVIWSSDYVPPDLHQVVHSMEDVVGRPHTVF